MKFAKHRQSFFTLLLFLIVNCQFVYSATNTSIHFSADQVAAGYVTYLKNCMGCHGIGLTGTGVVPSLYGDSFMAKWAGKPVSELITSIQQMPPDEPAPLTLEEAIIIAAKILHYNGIKATEESLAPDQDLLTLITIPSVETRPSIVDEILVSEKQSAPVLSKLTSIKPEQLISSPDADWLSWQRTTDAQGFSPLTQINKKNVNQLQLNWKVPLPNVESMPTPLVRDGVMFVYTSPDTVLALNATNGDLLWKYQHPLQKAASKKMSMALYGDLLIVPTSDFQIVALSTKTGKQQWSHKIQAEPVNGRIRYSLRGAPLIAGDKVIQGVNGSGAPGGGFIVAIDLLSGKEAWRFYTVAKPGTPGGNSWNGLPWEKRTGGSVWHNGTYDSTLNLVYYGAAATYDTKPLLVPSQDKGVTNSALYTNATIALNKDTGELAWFFQHMPNDQYDLDWAFERQLLNIKHEGKNRRVVITTGKVAITEVLDAATGEYLFSIDSGLQNIIASIDKKTGHKNLVKENVADPEVTKTICPSLIGSRSWPAAAINPKHKTLFLPLTEDCMEVGPNGIHILSSGIGIKMMANPDRKDNKMARLQAIDIEEGKIKWNHRMQMPFVSSAIATDSGLLFVGDIEPALKAFDQKTGEVVWHTALEDFPSSGLITYAVDGKQYLAVIVGQRNNHVRDRRREYVLAMENAGEKVTPINAQGSFIQVYALPEENR